MVPEVASVSPGVRAALLRQARLAWPQESIAALGGRRTRTAVAVHTSLPLANASERQGRFRVAPQQFLAALAALQAEGHCWLGFAHSHPGGAPRPSATDRRELWPHCLQVVVAGAAPDLLQLAAFWLSGTDCWAVPLPCPATSGELVP
jgi:proteasome lid subunit RPN8/RPN11